MMVTDSFSQSQSLRQKNNQHRHHYKDLIFDQSSDQYSYETEYDLSFLTDKKSTKKTSSHKKQEIVMDSPNSSSLRYSNGKSSNMQRILEPFNLMESLCELGQSLPKQSSSQIKTLPPKTPLRRQKPAQSSPIIEVNNRATREPQQVNSYASTHNSSEKKSFQSKHYSPQDKSQQLQYITPTKKSMSKDSFVEVPEEPVSYESFKTMILSKEFSFRKNTRLSFNKHKNPVKYIEEDQQYRELLVKIILASLNSEPLLILFGVTALGDVTGTSLTLDEIQNEISPDFARCQPPIQNGIQVIFHEKIIEGYENSNRTIIIVEVVPQPPSMYYYSPKGNYYSPGPNYELKGLSLINEVQAKCKKDFREAEEKVNKNQNLIKDLLSVLDNVKNQKDIQSFTRQFKDQIIENFL